MSPANQLAQHVLDLGDALYYMWITGMVLFFVIGLPVVIVRGAREHIEYRGWTSFAAEALKAVAVLGFLGLLVHQWLWGAT